ncbi:hypothetical protein DL93DRAFT_2126926 [Clavulina sp. PMI_390]|nr:hypothetical protein DL93DRAFT_2126926 [Clavulina sp. PMI_390]
MSSVVEKGRLPWDGYLDDQLPEKAQGRWIRNLRHQVFSLYRRFFGVIFLTNALVLIIYSVNGHLTTSLIGQITASNLMVSILFRQDHIINTLFGVFCRVPVSWPLWIRSTCAEIYHVGGIHSGCSFSATIWFIYFSVKITLDFADGMISLATLVVTHLIVLLLVLMFAGWLATALFWTQTILLANDTKAPNVSLSGALIDSPPFWMISIVTISIILPWTRLRLEPVTSEVLSSHAVRLYFQYDWPVPGSFARVSTDPLREWHSFATIRLPEEKVTGGFSMIISRAGDWTSRCIDEPPTKLWVRGVPTSGVMRVVPLFRRVVVIATGSGMGPCAPHVFAQKTPIKLLWTAPNVRETFGDKFVDAVVKASPDALIYDTRKHGKPDMVKLICMFYRLVKEFDAEAVCIISNPTLTYKVVYGMRSRGIHAYGAIWDS